jgi:AcrR family transcriptional regulator
MTTTASTTNWHSGQPDVAGGRGVLNGGGSRPSGLRERMAQRTRADLIDAAVKLCLSVGYERTTVEMIAGEADVSTRTFSRYFASKDAVFLAVMDPVSDDLVFEVSSQSRSVGPLEAMRAAYVAVFTRIAECPYGCPSADQVAVMLRVVNSSERLRKKVPWCWCPGTYGLGLGRARRRMTGSSRSVFCS